jgi:putative heme transporter
MADRTGTRIPRQRGAAIPPRTPRRDAAPVPGPPWWRRPFVRLGAYAWAFVGLVIVGWMLTTAAGRLSILVYPLVLALFPAALLSPVSEWLTRHRVPPALAALATLLGFLVLVVGGTTLLAPQVMAEAPGLVAEVQEGLEELQDLLDEGVFGWEPPIEPGELLTLAQEQGLRFLQDQAVAIATGVAEGLLGLLFGLVALFFYLKDGHRIAAWIRSLAPRSVSGEVHGIGEAAWDTIGQYFRGQLFVALVDAVFIGLGLWLLGVPLVLPLAVLVFFGGLFPIVGAFVSGAVAVLVALAAEGFGIALATLAIVVAVQQLESNVLAPVVLGRATALHPLAVIVVLTAGGVLLGVVGAFLAVPVAASVAKAVGIVRERRLPAPAA